MHAWMIGFLSLTGDLQQVAEQLVQTDGLLDKYANMLAKSESVTRLIFDEQWEGAEAVGIDFYFSGKIGMNIPLCSGRGCCSTRTRRGRRASKA